MVSNDQKNGQKLRFDHFYIFHGHKIDHDCMSGIFTLTL